MSNRPSILFILLTLYIFSCQENQRSFLFQYIPTDQSNIDFVNRIEPNDEVNIIDFQYCYNGGGVGVGDFNRDGLPDLIFTGNQVPSKIYLNKQYLQFEDVTTATGIDTRSWITGVSIVDINADGWDDIYLNVGGANCNNDCPNLLYINQGNNKSSIPTFIEQAGAYGLQEGNYAQQTVFFDYDLDGDLDAYIARNGNLKFDKNSPIPKRYFPDYLSDVLLRNDQVEGIDHPVFIDISEASGVISKGFSLGVGIQDFDNNGRPDIYVANDFITNDLLLLNKQNKDSLSPYFENKADHLLAHQTYNAMGVDIADVNGDALADILVLDMLPADYGRQKRMMGAMNFDKFTLGLNNGYTPQYVRNTLQLNNGVLNGSSMSFSEVSFQSGIAKTDWSWAPLIADYDMDGDNDIFITNGYGKDITDLDFVNYTLQNTTFGTEETRNEALKKSINDLKKVKLQNFFFRNEQNTSFSDVSESWANTNLSLSNGAAYADLDLDGDLDMIVSNIDQPAFIMENQTLGQEGKYYLKVKLSGNAKNTHAIGSKIELWQNGEKQSRFYSVIRGYLSSVEPVAVFGLNDEIVDSVKVTWPRGNHMVVINAKSNQTLYITEENTKLSPTHPKDTLKTIFKSEKGVLSYTHQENMFNDFIHQKLLLRQHSKSGPCMASTKIEGVKGDVLFIGGSHGTPGSLWKQNESGVYDIYQKLDSIYEDSDALFFDYDSDGDKDLYVASGGSEFEEHAREYQDRLYRNEGKGVFTKTTDVLPVVLNSSSCVRSADVDQDGDIDLFVGSSILPRKYPSTPGHQLLINENGQYKEVKIESLDSVGMIKDVQWADVNNDGWSDLMIVGDWMPITLFINNVGKLENSNIDIVNTQNQAISTEGWWRTIETGDLDNDGDIDFIIGNHGTNNFINPSQNYPLYIYRKDFDQNGSVDPLIGGYYEVNGQLQLMPMHSRDDVTNQLVKLKSRFVTYEDFSKVRFEELLSIDKLEEETYKVKISESVVLKNMGNSLFQLTPLPQACQTAPINDILLRDFNNDKHLDALLIGNDLTSEVHYGRYDAFHGALLAGDGEGNFEYISPTKSGFYAPQQGSRVITLNDQSGQEHMIVGRNSEEILLFKKSANEN